MSNPFLHTPPQSLHTARIMSPQDGSTNLTQAPSTASWTSRVQAATLSQDAKPFIPKSGQLINMYCTQQ
jgi:hypothetical protein